MEMWARYAHKALWHDYEPGWALHKSHHEPRTGPFEVRIWPCEFELISEISILTVQHAWAVVMVLKCCSPL